MARRLEMPGRWQAQGQLGVAVPRPIPMPGNAPSIPATIPGARQDASAAGAVGRMIAGMGQDLMNQGFQAAREELAFQDQQIRARRASDVSERKSQFARSMVDLELEAAKDPDPVGAPKRFEERAQQLRTSMAEGLADPVTRRLFTQDTDGLFTSKLGSVKHHSWEREKSGKLANLNEQMADWASARSVAGDVEAKITDQQARQTLTDYQAAGWIDEATMIKLDRGYRQAWQLAKAERLVTDNPRLAAKMVDEGAFPDVGALKNQQIRDTALTRFKTEQRAQQAEARAARGAAVAEARLDAADVQETYRRGYLPDPKAEEATRATLARLGDTKTVEKLDRARRTFQALDGFESLPLEEQAARRNAIVARGGQSAESAAVLNRMDQLHDQAAREARAANTEALGAARQQATELVGIYRRGEAPKPEALDQVRGRLRSLNDTAGVELLDKATALHGERVAFAGMPAAEQAQRLQQLGLEPFKDDDQADRLDMMTKIYQDTLKRREDDALGLGQERGLFKLAPIDFSNVQGLALSFGRRQQQGRMAQEQYGTPFPQIMTKAETQQFKDMLDRADPRAKAELVGALHLGLDRDTFDGVARTLWKQDPMTGFIAGLASSDGGVPLASSVAQGEALRKKDSKLAPEAEIGPPLRNSIGETFREMPQAGTTFADGVRNHYAFLAARAGRTDGRVDPALLDQAVKEVTGGILDWNGGKIVAPRRDLDESRFDTMMARIEDRDLATYSIDGKAPVDSSGKPLGASVLRDARLVSVGEGQYAVEIQVRKPGAWFGREPKFLMDSRGGRYVIDLGRAVDELESRRPGRAPVPNVEGVVTP